MRKKTARFAATTGALALALGLGIGSCDSESEMPMMMDPELPPFETVPPSVYASKVKNLLTGQALTEAELMSISTDPPQLATLIDTWQTSTEGRAKLRDFFKRAFQQTQLSTQSINDALPPLMGVVFDDIFTGPKLQQNVEDSFARTAIQLIDTDRPFHEAMSTEQYMMTPALMALVAYQDSMIVNDTGTMATGFRTLAVPGGSFIFTSTRDLVFTSTVIPISQSIDPTSANFMRWTIPTSGPAATLASCMDPMTFPGSATYQMGYRQQVLMNALSGSVFGCPPTVNPIFTQADFDTWKMVRIRRPVGSELPTAFFDLPTLRSGNELVVNRPTVGFFSALGFQANWPTNVGNQHRITANQTMIVALGKPFGINTILPGAPSNPADSMHATGSCAGCHWALDPTRLIFQQQLNIRGLTLTGTPPGGAAFAFEDKLDTNVTTLTALGQTLATHGRFATAWTQKLCYYANSVACDESDPEFQRIVQVFKDSGFRFRTLVRELFSSPLVTLAQRTQTFTNATQPVTISRREHLCAALQNRLGLNDVCGDRTVVFQTVLQRAIASLGLSIPVAGYSRGSETPISTMDPNLFFSASVENICFRLAGEVVDKGATSKYASTNAQTISTAIDDFVATVMDLPHNDSRNAGARALLQAHYDEAKDPTKGNLSASDALKSTFVLACMSPTSIAIGL